MNQNVDRYEGLPAGFALLERDSAVVEANGTLGEMLGYPRERLVGRKFEAWLAPESRNGLHRHLEQVLASPGIRICELTLAGRDGATLHAEFESRRQDDRVACVIFDVTRRVKADRLKDEFINLVAHELRNPITVLMAALDLAMMDGVSPEDVKTALSTASRNTAAMSDLLDKLLEIARSQTRKPVLSLTRTDIVRIVRDTVEEAGHRYAPRSVALTAGQSQVVADVDPLKLYEIVKALIDAAAGYTQDTAGIRVTVRINAGTAFIGVTAPGLELSPEEKERLFEPFDQLRAAAKGEQSPGQGLILCKGLVEAHNGEVWVESEAGRGSTFWFTLPV